MSSFAVLEELGRELVQQAVWSECLILPEVEHRTLAATESHRLNSLFLSVQRRLTSHR